MLDLTVGIRTYNRANELAALLDCLQQQVKTEGIQWEVVVVDNNSSDHTSEVVKSFQINWGVSAPLKYVLELNQGAAAARLRIFQDALGSWVGFLDDDTLPALDWVYQAYQFSQSYPKVGAYGGKIQAKVNGTLPENFQKIAPYFAVIDRGTTPFCYNHRKSNVLPPGTNIIISKQAWLQAVPTKLKLLGPTQDQLTQKGEDIEILSYLQMKGWEIWYTPSLQCLHQIPDSRLKRDYLLNFAWGTGLSRHHIRMLRMTQQQRLFMPLIYWLNDLYKLLYVVIRNMTSFRKDSVAAFEVVLFASILISPLYHFFWLRLFKKP